MVKPISTIFHPRVIWRVLSAKLPDQLNKEAESEYRNLLEEAGFKMTAIVPTASPVSIIESTPV